MKDVYEKLLVIFNFILLSKKINGGFFRGCAQYTIR